MAKMHKAVFYDYKNGINTEKATIILKTRTCMPFMRNKSNNARIKSKSKARKMQIA